MPRRVTVDLYDGAAHLQSAAFEVFDGRLPVAGGGGLLHTFGVEELLWEDSCVVAAEAGLDGLSRRRMAAGITTVRVLLPRRQ